MSRPGFGGLAIYFLVVAVAAVAFGIYTFVSAAQDGNPGTLFGAFLIFVGIAMALLAMLAWSRRSR
jgi:ABC-type transport system involved in cytochrome c biogenesis permease subunit